MQTYFPWEFCTLLKQRTKWNGKQRNAILSKVLPYVDPWDFSVKDSGVSSSVFLIQRFPIFKKYTGKETGPESRLCLYKGSDWSRGCICWAHSGLDRKTLLWKWVPFVGSCQWDNSNPIKPFQRKPRAAKWKPMRRKPLGLLLAEAENPDEGKS